MSIIPPMPWDTTAYLADTGHLSTLEHGAYGLILQAMWRSPDGTLDGSDAYLARAARMTLGRWKRIAPTIRKLLTAQGNRVTQKRVQRERKLSTEKAIPTETPNRSVNPLKSKDPVSKTAPAPESALYSLELDSDSNDKKRKKERKGGIVLPADWRPADAERLYGRTVQRLTESEIDDAAEQMRRWALTNRHRAIARKSDWDLTFRNWLDRYATERRPANVSNSQRTNNGFASYAAEVARQKQEEQHDGPTLDLTALPTDGDPGVHPIAKVSRHH